MFTFIFSFFFLFAPTDWQLHKDRDGVQVFTRKTPDKSFKQVKAVMTVDASLSTMTAIIKGGEDTPKWADRLKIYKTLKSLSNTEWYSYAEVSMPWPFKNKDIATKNLLSQDKDKTVNIQVISVPDYTPKVKDKDRIKKSEGAWIFKPLGKGKTEVTYLFYTEPDGILPQWMVTPLVVNSVYTTMHQLRDFARTEKYKNVRLDYISE